MNKRSLILKNFHHADKLTVKKTTYRKHIEDFFEWLIESDQVEDDTTTRITLGKLKPQKIEARIICKNDLVIGGIEETTYLLQTLTKIGFNVRVSDGDRGKKGKTILELSGTAQDILRFERSILNILQRISGVATETARFVQVVEDLRLKTPPYILATRKTPLMFLDKKGVALGRGLTHRLNLSDGILVKDNHLLLIKKQYGLTTEPEIIKKVIKLIFSQGVEFAEIEVEEDESILAAMQAFEQYKKRSTLGILLDNFMPERAYNAIRSVGSRYSLDNVIFEASGGVTFDNISEWAKSNVDIISIGALTHSVKAADLSLEIFT